MMRFIGPLCMYAQPIYMTRVIGGIFKECRKCERDRGDVEMWTCRVFSVFLLHGVLVSLRKYAGFKSRLSIFFFLDFVDDV